MTSDPLRPILRAAAEVMLDRPVLAGRAENVDRFINERRRLLMEALTRVRWLRSQARARLHIRRDQPETRALATLVLSPDDDVVQAGLTVARRLETERRAQQKLRRRHQEKLDQLRRNLDRVRGQYENSRAELRESAAALAETGKRAESLDTQLAALQRRLRDPAALASGLLAVLQQEREPHDEDPEARDPRNRSEAEKNTFEPLLLRAARVAGIEPPVLVTALQAIVVPPPASSEASSVQVIRERHLRVRPLGGATEIGGSCLLVEAGRTRLLIDAGLRPGDPALPPRDIEQALSTGVDAVVVTHAHIDHCGYVPALAGRLPGLRILATPETAQLMPRMWADSLKLMGERERVNRRWGLVSESLYGREADEEATRRCEEVPFGIPRAIGDLTIELFPAGHILGAAGVVIRAGEQRVVVTGDISGFRQESVDGYSIPDSALDADLLVMESTCCIEDHSSRETRVNDLVRAVEEVYSAGGRVLIPAFALGRAQEIALILKRHLSHVPVLVDGMAADITASFEHITIDRMAPLRILGGNVARARHPDDLQVFKSGVVISTSGMLSGGPAVEWATRILPDARSALFLSGYQDEESGGAKLLRLVEEQASHLVLNVRGEERRVPLRARVEMMRLSAHADRRGLLDIADEVGAREVMLVHGVRNRQREFAKILEVRGHNPVASAAWGIH